MKTFSLIKGDLEISNHNFVRLGDVDTLKQRIINRLKLFLGEFLLSIESGMDWFSLNANENVDEIESAVSRELKRDEEILSVDSIEVILVDTKEKSIELQKEIRTAFVSYSCNTVYGIISGSV